ncbi:unnamed protein product [Polarella glacialis]|uniref:Uncharacterized protein n=1 Tax=Polarella glacialis TaxID=89957 RepID=A0A813HQA4_POLGL|nr:unnamed protein product [Polarella glacialis]
MSRRRRDLALAVATSRPGETRANGRVSAVPGPRPLPGARLKNGISGGPNSSKIGAGGLTWVATHAQNLVTLTPDALADLPPALSGPEAEVRQLREDLRLRDAELGRVRSQLAARNEELEGCHAHLRVAQAELVDCLERYRSRSPPALRERSPPFLYQGPQELAAQAAAFSVSVWLSRALSRVKGSELGARTAGTMACQPCLLCGAKNQVSAPSASQEELQQRVQHLEKKLDREQQKMHKMLKFMNSGPAIATPPGRRPPAAQGESCLPQESGMAHRRKSEPMFKVILPPEPESRPGTPSPMDAVAGAVMDKVRLLKAEVAKSKDEAKFYAEASLLTEKEHAADMEKMRADIERVREVSAAEMRSWKRHVKKEQEQDPAMKRALYVWEKEINIFQVYNGFHTWKRRARWIKQATAWPDKLFLLSSLSTMLKAWIEMHHRQKAEKLQAKLEGKWLFSVEHAVRSWGLETIQNLATDLFVHWKTHTRMTHISRKSDSLINNIALKWGLETKSGLLMETLKAWRTAALESQVDKIHRDFRHTSKEAAFQKAAFILTANLEGVATRMFFRSWSDYIMREKVERLRKDVFKSDRMQQLSWMALGNEQGDFVMKMFFSAWADCLAKEKVERLRKDVFKSDRMQQLSWMALGNEQGDFIMKMWFSAWADCLSKEKVERLRKDVLKSDRMQQLSWMVLGNEQGDFIMKMWFSAWADCLGKEKVERLRKDVLKSDKMHHLSFILLGNEQGDFIMQMFFSAWADCLAKEKVIKVKQLLDRFSATAGPVHQATLHWCEEQEAICLHHIFRNWREALLREHREKLDLEITRLAFQGQQSMKVENAQNLVMLRVVEALGPHQCYSCIRYWRSAVRRSRIVRWWDEKLKGPKVDSTAFFQAWRTAVAGNNKTLGRSFRVALDRWDREQASVIALILLEEWSKEVLRAKCEKRVMAASQAKPNKAASEAEATGGSKCCVVM